jgi:hypothetical protein
MKICLATVALVIVAIMPACGGDDVAEPADLSIHFSDMRSTDLAQLQPTVDAGPCPTSMAQSCDPYGCEQSVFTGAYACYVDCNCAYQIGCAPGHHCVNCFNNVGTCN